MNLLRLGFCLNTLLAPMVVFAEHEESTSAPEVDHEETPDQEHSSLEHHEEVQASRPRIFKGYSLYRERFREICNGIMEDGRLPLWDKLIRDHSERDPFCSAYRPLMQSLSGGCAGAVKKAPKKERKRSKKDAESEETEGIEPTPSPTPNGPLVQREPSPVVINGLSNLFALISEDSARALDSVCAVRKLIFILRQQPGLKLGEKEYLDIIAEYVEAPFHTLLNTKTPSSTEEGGAGGDRAPQVNVDALFDE